MTLIRIVSLWLPFAEGFAPLPIDAVEMACAITGTSVVVAGLSVGTVAPYAPYRDQQGATWTQWIVVGQVC